MEPNTLASHNATGGGPDRVAPAEEMLPAMTRDARSALAAGSFSSFTSRIRVHVTCATSRIDSVPQARCGDSREQPVAPASGFDISRR